VKWRWLLFDYVDPQLNLSREERRRVRRRAWTVRKVRSTFRWIDLVGGMIGPVVMVLVLLPMFLSARFTWWWLFPMFFVQLSVGWILLALVARIQLKPRVNSALRELGYEVCHRCGYWLRDLVDTVDRCPECGHTREELSAPPT